MTGGHFHEREHWRALARGLHIEDRSLFENVAGLELSPGLADRFAHDGYLQASADWGLDLGLMADAVRSLAAANLSPLFALLYDEFWYPFFKLHPLLEALLGGAYRLLPDFWILNVDPKKGEAGWRPHRDKGRRALFDDGSPKSLTVWIPLSVATPLNGCLYVVPVQQDPTYGTADETEMKFEHQSIRALPAAPGEFIVWNHALFHWGGRTSPAAAESRVSMAFQCQRADVPPFDAPLIDPVCVPPFEARLRLVAAQLYRYRHMYELDPELIRLASDPLDQPSPALVLGGARDLAAPSAQDGRGNPPGRAKVGRNELCPCGSGQRYQQCHGALA